MCALEWQVIPWLSIASCYFISIVLPIVLLIEDLYLGDATYSLAVLVWIIRVV